MLTIAAYLVVALIVGAAVFSIVAVVFGGDDDLVEVSPDDRPLGVPLDRPLTSEEVLRVQLPVSLRGYRMADTDQLLDRLGYELAEREQELADLREQLAQRRGYGFAGHDRSEPPTGSDVADVAADSRAPGTR